MIDLPLKVAVGLGLGMTVAIVLAFAHLIYFEASGKGDAERSAKSQRAEAFCRERGLNPRYEFHGDRAYVMGCMP